MFVCHDIDQVGQCVESYLGLVTIYFYDILCEILELKLFLLLLYVCLFTA